MARFSPTDVLSSYASVAALNSNFDDIASLMERVVFRDGTDSNGMLADLDLNHFKLTNLADAVDNTDAVPYGQMYDEFVNVTRGPAGPDTQEVLDELLSEVGAGNVGYVQGSTGSVAVTVQDKLREGALSVLDFMTGVKRNDVLNRTALYDHSAEINTALQAAIDAKKALYLPGGLYIYGGPATGTRIEPVIQTGDDIMMFGDGPGITVIKETAGGNIGYSTDRIININVPDNVTANNIIIRDFTIDKNGASNGALPTGAQQSHALSVYSGTTSSLIRNLLIENIETVDKTGGGIILAAGFITNAIIRNCHGRGFAGLVTTERGDFENQAIVDRLLVESCSGPFAQTEPNVTVASGHKPISIYSNCAYDVLQLEGFSADVTAQTNIIVHSDCVTALQFINTKALVYGGRHTVSTVYPWRRTAEGSGMWDGVIINAYTSGTNSISPFYPVAETTLGGFYFTFNNTKWEPGVGASGTTTGTAIQSIGTYDGTQPFILRFVDCKFSSFYQQTADCYRNGVYEFIRCKMAGWITGSNGTVRVGAATTTIGSILLDSCDFSACTAPFNIWIQNSNTLWKLTLRGTHKYAEVSKQAATGTNAENMCSFEGVLTSDSRPALGGMVGMVVTLPKATLGLPSQYLCTVYHATAATWRMCKQNGIGSGTTANRPASLTAAESGLLYDDTTLAAGGKLIKRNATAWTDMVGVVV